MAEKRRKLRKTRTPGLYRSDPSRNYREGAWLVGYRDGYNGTRMKTFATKQEAMDFMAAVRTDKRRGDFIDPRAARTPFATLAKRWITTREERLTPATLAGYRSALKTRLLPAFGSWSVNRIQPADIETMLTEEKEGRRLSPGTQQNVLRVMSPIMNLAVRDGMIRSNPCQFVDIAPKPRNKMRKLTARQVDQLAAEVGAGQNATFVYLAAYSGMRAGEIVALKKKHVKLGRIDVAESVTDVNGKLHTGPPKNGKPRTVSIPSFLGELLAAQLTDKKEEDYVFAGRQGGILRYGNWYGRVFRPAVAQLTGDEAIPKQERSERYGAWADDPQDLRRLRFHDLRHTAASLLIARGIHAKIVSEHLGHSSIAITMDRYGHLYPESQDAVVKALDKTYKDAAKGTEPVTAKIHSIN